MPLWMLPVLVCGGGWYLARSAFPYRPRYLAGVRRGAGQKQRLHKSPNGFL
ncbi:hypothetical protein [Hymenobacter crusticola]|uniref:hypothetical protein n=1 Tax=Hymenobacter crusticola TaxID=1770526 RepID=UPI0015C51E51|nr:hypothetical protein [Hymenobacter crusticola]